METTEVASPHQLTVVTTDGPSAIITTQEAERDGFVTVACALIEELIQQMEQKDAPPTNDMGGKTFGTSPRSSLHRNSWHHKASPQSANGEGTNATSQNSNSTSTALQGTSSFETSDSSRDATAFFQELLKDTALALSDFPPGHPVSEYYKALEEKMNLPDRLGHTTLTALSKWTLNILGVDRKPSTSSIPLQIETSLVPVNPSAKSLSTPHQRTRRWRKNRHSPTKTTRLGSPTVRLQMFGSEYARHLSNSALAPTLDGMRPRRNLMRKPWKGKTLPTLAESPIYLDDADISIQTGALLDIVISTGETPPPFGFHRLGSARQPFKLERGKQTLHFDVKKEPSWDKAAQRPCITALTIIFPDRYEFVPPGFSIVRDRKCTRLDKSNHSIGMENHGKPVDIGLAERSFLCFRRSREGNPITGVIPLSPSAAETVPSGFTVLEKTPRNYVASIQEKPGQAVFLAYQQRLANLETLRPLPLLMSVLVGRSERSTKYDDDLDASTLEAFYATSGTIVHAEVGRFHIMDRSTHSLLSPSSISNRLSLIEKSRISAGKKGLGVTESTDIITLSRTTSMSSSRGDYWDKRCLPEGLSEMEDSRSDLYSFHDEDDPAGFAAIFRSIPSSVGRPNFLLLKEEEKRSCNAAMSFIPEIETVSGSRTSMNRLQTRCILITPMLTSCYNRHGGSALVAVEGLYDLLTKTDFFEDDVELTDDGDDESCRRLTLLDLAIQVVCDVTTCGAQETTFAACVEFVEAAVSFSQAQLNTRTIGYVIRFYLFIFYFDATIPTANAEWPNPAWGAPSPPINDDGFGKTASVLYDPRTNGGSKYLPGGAPQSAALALKELISMTLVRLGKVSVSSLILSTLGDPSTQPNGGRKNQDIGSFVNQILTTTLDDAVLHVERANIAQLALHQIHRSGGSELFWYDMVYSCGTGLFARDTKLTDAARDVYTMSFALLANLTKIAYGKSKSYGPNHEKLPRDVASKNLSLELLLHFLESWSDQQEAVTDICGHEKSYSMETLTFVVRRMIAPCLLSNTKMALEDSAIFSRVIRIVFELWKSPAYRRYCKVELGVLIEQFVILPLQLGPQLLKSIHTDLWSEKAGQSLHFQQLSLLKELKRVFVVEPKQAVEMFVNFDTDSASQDSSTIQLLQVSQWKLFQKMSSTLSTIAEQCGEIIGRQIEEHRSMIASDDENSVVPKNEGSNAGVLVDKTTIRESARSLRTASLEALSEMVRAVALSAGAASSPQYSCLFASWSSLDAPVVQDDTVLQTCTTLTVSEERSPIPFEPESPQPESKTSKEKAIEIAIEISNRKSLKRGIEYLIACNVLPPSPRDIATFLRIHKDSLDPTALGHYLGECGVGGTEIDYWNAIRLSFVRPISFVGMNVDQSLRHFLTHSGFVLPGEAQKIDRIINTFAQCYFEDNAGDVHVCPFRNEDTVYMLCFAVIMLNTDLHKMSAGARKGKKMSKTDFIQNLRGVENGDDIPRQYLSDIYDSIEANPIALDDNPSGSSSSSEDNNAIVQDMLNNVRVKTSLLHSLAVHDFKFVTTKDVGNALGDSHQAALSHISRDIVSKHWHHWHGVISTCLETAHLDLQGMESCIDILLYSLATCVCLGMEMEKAAFLTQLGRLKSFEELRQGGWVQAPDNDAFQSEDWYIELEEACNGSEERRIWALRNIREWMESAQGALLEDVHSKAELTRVVTQLENGELLLQDPARGFIRSGDLLKKSGRTGRTAEYRFFLFSDILVYAKPGGSGKYRIHEELPLYQMKVVDWYPSTQKSRQRSFDIHHPRKKFTVLCCNPDERKGWVEDIRKAISSEVERKMNIEAARLAIITNDFTIN